MNSIALEVVTIIFGALGCGFTIWGVINWLSGSKAARPGLDAKTQLIIGLAISLCATNAYHLLYPICNSNTTQENIVERIKLYSESGVLISDYKYVTDVRYTSTGNISFTAEDGTSITISGGTVVREKQ